MVLYKNKWIWFVKLNNKTSYVAAEYQKYNQLMYLYFTINIVSQETLYRIEIYTI